MSDNTMIVLILVLIVVASVFFSGDPDLVDAFIIYLIK